MRRHRTAHAAAAFALCAAVVCAYDPLDPEDDEIADIDSDDGDDQPTKSGEGRGGEKRRREEEKPARGAKKTGAGDAAASAVFESMPVKELKGILRSRGIDAKEEGLMEKSELVSRVISSAGQPEKESTRDEGHSAVRKKSKSRRQSRTADSGRVVIKYCQSWGYRKLYEDYARELQRNFPQLEVTGETHLPAPPIQAIATVLQFIFYGGLMMSFVGGLNNIPAPLGPWLQENKGMGMMGLFLLNVVAGQLLATGAFEIFVNDELVFSKMETGQVPQLKFLLRKLDSKLGYTP